jgi:glycosyltransferase involved in cell wall biosynthesis
VNILFLPAYFTPEVIASSRLSSDKREALARAGFEMLVIAPTPTRGITKDVREKYKQTKQETMLNGKLTVRRFSMVAEGTHSVGRAVRYLLCNVAQLYYGIRAEAIDVLLVASTPPTQGAMGALVKKIKKIPMIYNLQDVFPDSLVGTGLTRQGSLLWRIGRGLENFTYRNADKIIVISEDIKKNIMAKGVPESKIEVIYNWVDENAVRPVAPGDNKLFDELGLNKNDFHAVYAGNLGNAQNIEIILKAAESLREHTDIKFIIFGTGGLERALRESADNLKLKNLLFFPLQSAERIAEVYSLGNVCIVSCQPGLGMSAMPSKTWSIMSAGTAVLASFDEATELQRIIESKRLGVFCPAGDVEAFAGAVIKLSGNPKLCAEFGQNGRRFILNNLTRDVGTSKYVEVIRSVVNKQPGGS